MEKRIYHLILNDGGYRSIIVSANLTSVEADVMVSEVNLYQEHIERLSDGIAPPSCYENSEMQRLLYLAKHQHQYTMFPRPGNRGLYERLDLSIDLVREDGSSMTDGYDYDEDELNSVKEGGMLLDETFFMQPLRDNDVRSLGYALLPMTAKMFNECRSCQ